MDPLNESIRHIIGVPEFQKMKDGVVIVNTARGALIDEKALIAALNSGKSVSNNKLVINRGIDTKTSRVRRS
jgi:lactate dehydrogenase-like 2-hydroxyacid dehydrogenase